ncbi:hypothetical protein Hanom_Chr17g01587941 [Helianthus anomalus]
MYNTYKEARWASRWDSEYECYIDPKGLKRSEVIEKRLKMKSIKLCILAWKKKKKKTVEEIVIESQKLVKDVKKEKRGDDVVAGKEHEKIDDETEKEVVAEKQQEKEDQKQKVENATVPIVEVGIQSKSSEMLEKVDYKIDEQCKKCMETCKACTEKDNNLRSRDIEFTKIEKIFKEKCDEMFENKKFLKQENKTLTQKCDDLERENEILKGKC